MPSRPENRAKHILVNLRPKEYERAMAYYKNSTCRSMSEFVRTLFLRGPVTVYYRDKAYDEFIETAIQLRNGLEALAASETFSDEEKDELIQKMDKIKEQLNKIYDYVRQNK
jgi:hypothetical protein